KISTGAPPTSKPISIKVRGDDPQVLRQAADEVIRILQDMPAISDITDDDVEGRMQLSVRLNSDAVLRAGLNPATVIRAVRLLADGEVVASMQHQGERLEVRVRARPEALQEIDSFLRHTIGLPDGSSVSLGQLLRYQVVRGKGNIRHYNLRRAITVEAELDKAVMDTVSANRLVRTTWDQRLAERFPQVDLDQTGEMDDIQESIDAIGMMFLFGLGLIYLILGTQFKSYIQPLIVLATVPMAFIGVVLGLLVSNNPLSVYTLYGVVALAGISVNAAIVLISAANDRLAMGMTIQHAIVYAARRRVLPVIITSTSTIAGLSSLAMGLGGRSLMWGPVAASIVWGLGVSTVLTLFVIPLLYRLVVRPPQAKSLPLPPPLPGGYASLLERARAPFRLGFSHSSAQQRLALETIAAREDLQHLYNQARRCLDEGDHQGAIRLFEQAAKADPGNLLLNLCAAQSLIMYLDEQLGWDQGYVNRTRRYLARARKLDADDSLLHGLEAALQQLESTQAARPAGERSVAAGTAPASVDNPG
ncbi:MAG: efflux RND transporter permease subunit, partial [Candidatus Competibacteraceae bacterium]|nr:efflux RND transporter permease subunit [Candidatus Competibacteraceae bacterium]